MSGTTIATPSIFRSSSAYLTGRLTLPVVVKLSPDERVVGQRLVYLDGGGVLEHDSYRVVILRSRQLDLRGQSQAALRAEGLLVAVDHVRYQLPALVVALHAREPKHADAVEPDAAQDARAARRRRLKLRQDVVGVYDARALLRAGARVGLLLERLGGGVDARRAFERDGLDEQRFGEVLRSQRRERAHRRTLHRLLSPL